MSPLSVTAWLTVDAEYLIFVVFQLLAAGAPDERAESTSDDIVVPTSVCISVSSFI